MALSAIFKDCKLEVSNFTPVHGGDINQCYCLESGQGKYFLKVNDATKHPNMLEKEARGLTALRENSMFGVPKVIRHGIKDNEQYLLLEWTEKGKPGPNFWNDFGNQLAMMHLQKQDYFGWLEDNYIGSLVQVNEQCASWATLYANYRILPLVKSLYDQRMLDNKTLRNTEAFCKNLDEFFPFEHPSLLHGDLWSGNYLVSESGMPAIFDPAVYCGHREMDIGITLLFGGFDRAFYDAYNETYPLQQNWKQRIKLTQLYPVLVHAVLFKGHYINEAKEIINAYC